MELDSKNLSKIIDEATNLLAKFSLPIYEDDHRGRPSLHGTGFIVQAGGQHFFVSAAHVLENLKAKPLYYYIGPSITRKLSGKLLLNRWRGDREKDPVDIGILRLTSEGLPPYPDVSKFAVDISYLRPRFLPRSGKHYLVVGFPGSRSKTNPLARETEVTVYGFRNASIKDSEYYEHGLENELHVALSLNLKTGFDSEGKHRNFPKPQGMSGSPIWILFDDVGDNDERVFPLVAVGTKYRKSTHLLVGTDIAVVLDMINRTL
jgi:hypothetical protein